VQRQTRHQVLPPDRRRPSPQKKRPPSLFQATEIIPHRNLAKLILSTENRLQNLVRRSIGVGSIVDPVEKRRAEDLIGYFTDRGFDDNILGGIGKVIIGNKRRPGRRRRRRNRNIGRRYQRRNASQSKRGRRITPTTSAFSAESSLLRPPRRRLLASPPRTRKTTASPASPLLPWASPLPHRCCLPNLSSKACPLVRRRRCLLQSGSRSNSGRLSSLSSKAGYLPPEHRRCLEPLWKLLGRFPSSGCLPTPFSKAGSLEYEHQGGLALPARLPNSGSHLPQALRHARAHLLLLDASRSGGCYYYCPAAAAALARRRRRVEEKSGLASAPWPWCR